jgi:hypothetical protein
MLAQSVGLGLNYSVRPPFGPGNIHTDVDTLLMQYSLEYVVKSWTFQAEVLRRDSLFRDYARGSLLRQHRDIPWAWYVSAAYRPAKWLEIGTYYTEAYAESTNPANQYQKDVALALRFDLKRWWQLKIEGHCLKGTALVTDRVLNPTRGEEPWFMLAIKTTFSF